jgi:hypothetical protein
MTKVVNIEWFVDHPAQRLGMAPTGYVRVKGRALVVERWDGREDVLIGEPELFGTGLASLLALRYPGPPDVAVVMGEFGSELMWLDLDVPAASRIAELPRFPDSGMCRLQVLSRSEVVLIHWELGVLAIDDQLELRWRQDLEWNHEITHLDDDEIWFDFMYDSANLTQRIGVEPCGFSVRTGRQLFDRTPPVREE